MQHTESQRVRFKELYAKRRRNQLAVSVPLIAFVLVLAFAHDRQAETIFGFSAQVAGPILIVLVGGAIFFSYRNWRCPACNKYLGRTFNPKHCHSCGVELRG